MTESKSVSERLKEIISGLETIDHRMHEWQQTGDLVMMGHSRGDILTMHDELTKITREIESLEHMLALTKAGLGDYFRRALKAEAENENLLKKLKGLRMEEKLPK